jgi:hypothetical protein
VIFIHIPLVALNRVVYLFPPERFSRFGPLEQMAIVAMPETPVNQYDGLVAGKNDVWLPGKSFIV